MSTDDSPGRGRLTLEQRKRVRRYDAWRRRGFTREEAFELSSITFRGGFRSATARKLSRRRIAFVIRLRDKDFDEKGIEEILEGNYLARFDVGELVEEVYSEEEEQVLDTAV